MLRGGARPGAGRKKKDEPRARLDVRATPELLAQVEAECRRTGETVPEFVRQAVLERLRRRGMETRRLKRISKTMGGEERTVFAESTEFKTPHFWGERFALEGGGYVLLNKKSVGAAMEGAERVQGILYDPARGDTIDQVCADFHVGSAGLIEIAGAEVVGAFYGSPAKP